MSRLNETDLELLQTGQDIDLGSSTYAYLGGKFTENPNDYIEALVYDTNENFLESGVVDSGDYVYEEGEGIKLKTGTILRKLGYDRGRYVVKYNFLRKVAGSYQNVLVDSSNNRYYGEYHVMPGGKVMSGAEHNSDSVNLFIKENKYFIHEISPTRGEVRLAPLNIKDEKYLRDFYDVQHINKRVEAHGPGKTLRFQREDGGPGGDAAKAESYTLKSFQSDAQFSSQMIGGTIMIPNVFVVGQYHKPVPPGWVSTTTSTEEIEVEGVFEAHFYIENDDTALLQEGNKLSLQAPDGAIYKRFASEDPDMRQAAADDKLPENFDSSGIHDDHDTWEGQGTFNWATKVWGELDTSGGQESFNKIINLDDSIFDPPQYKPGGEILITSTSIKPDNVAINYIWQITGWDNDDPSDKDTWDPIVAGSDGDVEIIRDGTQGGEGLTVTDPDSTTGSKIRLKLNSWDMHVGIKLTIEYSDGSSTLHLPCCIETGKP